MLIGNYAPSLVIFRGPLMRRLVSLGHHVTAITPLDDLTAEKQQKIRDELTAMSVELHPVSLSRAGFGPLEDIAYTVALRRKILALKPDRILAYSMKPVAYAGLAARSLGHRHYYPLYSGLGYAFTDGGGMKKQLVRGVVVQLLKASMKGARAAIFQNPDDEALMRSLKVLATEQPSHVVGGSGVDMQQFEAAPIVTSPHGPSFLMVSRVLVDKGVREFAAAAAIIKKRHPGCRFRLLGMMDRVNPASPDDTEVALWHAVEYLGASDDVRPFLREADVFVLPSFYREGIPRSALEALATGRAVITTDRPGCREAVIEGENGFLVPARDAASLAAAMERFIVDPQLCVKMGARSLKYAQQRFDVDIVNQDILRIMQIT